MNFQSYLQYFEQILQTTNQVYPYDNPDYLNYTKLNWSRMHRWLKKGHLSEETRKAILSVNEPRQWIVITEPWCGDAAHIVPFIHMISELNPLITVTYELRDSEPNRIEHYLTNGGKSIPKLIIRDAEGTDLAVWGPRPEACQQFYMELTKQELTAEEVKIALQNWYNENEGADTQDEIAKIATQKLAY